MLENTKGTIKNGQSSDLILYVNLFRDILPAFLISLAWSKRWWYNEGDLWQVVDFFRVLRFPPPLKPTATT